MQNNNQYIEWIWRHIAFQLPSFWEMLQFSTEYNRGRCAFADYHQFRAELSWNIVKGEPDYERMVSNYIAKLEQDKNLSGAERQKKAGWYGFSGVINKENTSRFGYYLPDIKCLVEWSFIWPEERDAEIENTVLSSTHSALEDAEGHQQWKAFGMDMRVPKTAALDGCTVQAANVTFDFTDPKTGNSWGMSRVGMVNDWLRASLADTVKSGLRSISSDLRMTYRNRSGTEVIHHDGSFKPTGIHFKRGKLEAEAWIDPADGRLYQVQKKIRKQDAAADLPIEHLLRAAPEFTVVPQPS